MARSSGGGRTSKGVARKASALLRSKATSPRVKSVAGSALKQRGR